VSAPLSAGLDRPPQPSTSPRRLAPSVADACGAVPPLGCPARARSSRETHCSARARRGVRQRDAQRRSSHAPSRSLPPWRRLRWQTSSGGIAMGTFQERTVPRAPGSRRMWLGVGRHLPAAVTARQQLESVAFETCDAALSPDGQGVEARGVARRSDMRQTLRRAVRAREKGKAWIALHENDALERWRSSRRALGSPRSLRRERAAPCPCAAQCRERGAGASSHSRAQSGIQREATSHDSSQLGPEQRGRHEDSTEQWLATLHSLTFRLSHSELSREPSE
jgi:hypothetical protein